MRTPVIVRVRMHGTASVLLSGQFCLFSVAARRCSSAVVGAIHVDKPLTDRDRPYPPTPTGAAGSGLDVQRRVPAEIGQAEIDEHMVFSLDRRASNPPLTDGWCDSLEVGATRWAPIVVRAPERHHLSGAAMGSSRSFNNAAEGTAVRMAHILATLASSRAAQT